jgi:hypothetical protein
MASNIKTSQSRAISALLTCATIGAAAKEAKVGERTLSHWLSDDQAFRSEYFAARREVVSHSISQLQRACGEAVAALKDIATDETAPPGARVSACRTILEQSLRSIEVDELAGRVDVMSARLDAMSAEAKP